MITRQRILFAMLVALCAVRFAGRLTIRSAVDSVPRLFRRHVELKAQG